MGNKIQRIYVGSNQVRPSGLQYSIDFRGNTQSGIEADGRTFTARNGATWSFSSSGLEETKVSSQVFISRSIDLTKYTKVKLWGSCYLANKGGSWDGGIWLFVVPPGQNFWDSTQTVGNNANRNVGTSSSNRGMRLKYNGSTYSTGTALSAGEYTWELNIDLTTGAVSGSMNNGLLLSGTLTSTYINYINTSTTEIGVCVDSTEHKLHTFNAIFE